MLLNSQNISKFLIESEFSKKNQVGIDLSVKSIEIMLDNSVSVFQDKTVINSEKFINIEPIQHFIYSESNFKFGWLLSPGTYALTFNEKCNLDASHTGFILSRSSIYRGGSFICSPIWDPGFTTKDNFMGTTLFVTKTIFIEKNARVAQFFIHTNETPDSLYNGQFQGKTNY